MPYHLQVIYKKGRKKGRPYDSACDSQTAYLKQELNLVPLVLRMVNASKCKQRAIFHTIILCDYQISLLQPALVPLKLYIGFR